MPQFQFRLAALQRYREYLRDVVRQQLAELVARDAALAAQRDDVLTRRASTLHEMHELQQQSPLDVDQAAARRYHAGQLAVEARGLEWQRQQLAGLVSACRQRLVLADQGVKVLEKLADRQRQEFDRALERQDTRQRDEAWQAVQLVQNFNVQMPNSK